MKIINNYSEYMWFKILIVLLLVLSICSVSNAQTTADPGACYATTGHTDGGRLLKLYRVYPSTPMVKFMRSVHQTVIYTVLTPIMPQRNSFLKVLVNR